jgi:hypothetical protein
LFDLKESVTLWRYSEWDLFSLGNVDTVKSKRVIKVSQVTTISSLTARERSITEQYCEQELVGASVEAVSATHMFVFRGFCLLFAHVE